MLRVSDVERHVQRDDVRRAQQFRQQTVTHVHRVLGILAQPDDVVVLDAHVESARGNARDALADRAEADDAQCLVVHLVERRHRLIAAPAPAGSHFVLRHQASIDGEHQQDRMLGDSTRVGAAVVGDQHAGATGGIQIHPVVPRAEQLDQPQPRGGAVERIVHGLDIAQQVFGIGQRGGVTRAARRGDDEFEAGRRHFLCLLDRFGNGIDEHDLRRHGGFLPGKLRRQDSLGLRGVGVMARTTRRLARGRCPAWPVGYGQFGYDHVGYAPLGYDHLGVINLVLRFGGRMARYRNLRRATSLRWCASRVSVQGTGRHGPILPAADWRRSVRRRLMGHSREPRFERGIGSRPARQLTAALDLDQCAQQVEPHTAPVEACRGHRWPDRRRALRPRCRRCRSRSSRWQDVLMHISSAWGEPGVPTWHGPVVMARYRMDALAAAQEIAALLERLRPQRWCPERRCPAWRAPPCARPRAGITRPPIETARGGSPGG